MKIGIPKEIKNNENRVGMTPAGVAEFIRHGHEVMVQHTAGENSGFADEEYVKVGAQILPDIQSVYREAEMIVKVKEPIAEEYPLIHQDQLVFRLRQGANRCYDQKRCCLPGLRDGGDRQPSFATADSDE